MEFLSICVVGKEIGRFCAVMFRVALPVRRADRRIRNVPAHPRLTGIFRCQGRQILYTFKQCGIQVLVQRHVPSPDALTSSSTVGPVANQILQSCRLSFGPLRLCEP